MGALEPLVPSLICRLIRTFVTPFIPVYGKNWVLDKETVSESTKSPHRDLQQNKNEFSENSSHDKITDKRTGT
jgi:hypothetical protein